MSSNPPRYDSPGSALARLTAVLCSSLLVAGLTTAVAPATVGITSGENGLIAFSSARGGTYDIWTMAPDGSGAQQITATGDTDFYPQWSPDGQRIAFARDIGNLNFEVWVANADGSGATNLTNNAAWDDYPSWSPDGQKLAFSSTRGGTDFEIWVMNANGTAPVQLTDNDVTDDYPSWSPDGQKIAFMSERDGGDAEIYVMNANGTGQTRLTTSVGIDFFPQWSPDSQKLAFVSERDGNSEIYVMNADGTGQTRLTTDGQSDLAPAWSPDGSLIAFSTNRDGNYEIYLMSPTGAGQTRITNEPADDVFPAWNVATSGAGSVSAEVTIPSSAACLELSTTAVDFGTLPLGSELAVGAPGIEVTNCSGIDETIFVRGTDATGAGATWNLVDFTGCSDPGTALDTYGLGLRLSPELDVALAEANLDLGSLEPGGVAAYDALISTACPGSSGSGRTMSMSIIFLATE